MYKKVIFATDGSAAADHALVHAKALAAEGGEPLLVVYVEEVGGGIPIHVDETDVRDKIKRQAVELSSDGQATELEMVRNKVGTVARTIAEIADQQHGDVIVVGTRGHTSLDGLLLGSVTQRLLHTAPCPVLAVPPQARTPA
jgi:nucleotide-binding universal stress UspA family protein